MRKSKLLVSIILVMIIVMSMASASAEPGTRDWSGWLTEDEELLYKAVNSADSAILVDINSGRILFKKSAYGSMYPASITKIMTALLTIENAEMTDQVTINSVIAQQIKDLDKDSSVSGVKEGEVITVQDLLYGLMLESGNDAAVALANHVGGTYDAFIAMMNAKAIEIGMTDTTYTNPHGLTDEGHKTSARDMALLAMYAKQYPIFNEVVSTAEYKPSDTNLTSYSSGQAAYFSNTNRLINGDEVYGYEYATGIKTGYTQTSEHTLVSSAEYDGQSLVAVVLKDTKTGKWDNSRILFDYGFDFYDTIDIGSLYQDTELTTIVDEANLATTGDELIMTIGESNPVYITERTERIDDIKADPSAFFTEQTNFTTEQLTAPIAAGQQVGTVTYTYTYSHNSVEYLGYMAAEGEVQYFSYTAPLIAKNNIEAIVTETPEPEATAIPETTLPPRGSGSFDIGDFAMYAIVVLFIILILLLVILVVYRSKSESRYRKAQKSRAQDNRGGSGRRRH